MKPPNIEATHSHIRIPVTGWNNDGGNQYDDETNEEWENNTSIYRQTGRPNVRLNVRLNVRPIVRPPTDMTTYQLNE